ncbi:MAG TPA: hypothetical protein DCZ95_12275 [Verrucomicrobia bacterium]|nr:MAG: hypothetical protein A2X46_14320 [Lentisphaerae bacterium GWF2_57_35]HBA84861.1 hypothetical protein [Verrucomicrobiota bacterium]
MKRNCWEYKNCGRQTGGAKTGELGVCPASTATAYHGTNSGSNGGRHCWKIAGTMCGGQVQGSFATKMLNCAACEVFKTVRAEEGAAFKA